MVAARGHPRRRRAISGTRVRIDPFATEGTDGNWIVRWRITNASDQPIQLVTAVQPHSQFRTPETKVDREIAPGTAIDVALPVKFTESPGAIVENPFLILRMREDHEWLVLARVRVTAGSRGEPVAGRSVVVTTRKIEDPSPD